MDYGKFEGEQQTMNVKVYFKFLCNAYYVKTISCRSRVMGLSGSESRQSLLVVPADF